MARRTAEGMSKKEVIRCLKRFVARQVYRAIIADLATGDQPRLNKAQKTQKAA